MTQNGLKQDGGPRSTRRFVATAGLIAAAILAVVLYAIKAQDGKETASADCPGARAEVMAMRPLIHGEIAALSLSTQPKPLPDLKFADANGTRVSLADFKGRTVLLNLWATWCVPCRQEMPALDRLQAKLGSQDFTVVALNIDTARLERPKTFLHEIGVKDLDFFADNTAEAFQVLKGAGKALGLPTTILIGKHGCDLGVMAGPAQWDSPEAMALLTAAQGG
jgi:thiol-disulfide isomerase/thioredoxin